jgi:adenylylsulfate kinase-like enzyme
MNSSVTVFSGHSGAGKTTRAVELFWKTPTPCALVTQDHIRLPEGSDVTEFLIQIAQTYSNKGVSVIMDGVNLHPHDYRRWQEAFQDNVTWILVDTPLEECIRRDALRKYPVGEQNIRKQGEGW